MSLRIGVLGASRIAESAIVGPAAELGHRLVAVAARDRSRAEVFAEKYGVERVLDGYQDVIDDPEVDVVYNPLANSLHAPWNLAAIAAGKPVLSEKPFARDQSEARRVAEAADAAGVTVLEGFHYFFHPGHAARVRTGRRRHPRRGHPRRGADGDADARRRRPAVVARVGRRRTDGPGLLRPARHAVAGPARGAGHRGTPVDRARPRRAAHPRRGRVVRRRDRLPRWRDRPVDPFDGRRRRTRSPSESSARRAISWCTTSSSRTRTTD